MVFTPSGLFGQDDHRRQLAVESFDAGVEHMLDGKARKATRALEKAVETDSTFLPARRLLGVAFDLQDDYERALDTYLGVVRADPFFSRLLYYHIGDVYLRAGDPVRAMRYLRRFRDLQRQPTGAFGLMGEQERPTELKIVEDDLPGRLLAAEVMSDSLNYANATGLYNLGEPVNSPRNDYFPFFTNDLEALLFTRQSRTGDEDLMRGRRKTGNDYTARPFSSGFNTNQPEGMCTLVRDGETIFFTLCHENDGQGGCNLYQGRLVGDRIREVEKLPDYLNSDTWDSQAAISCDGRQLYFASTRAGGLGGSDIYRADRLANGSWSEPVNLGDAVNTPKDEEAPFLSNDGETLYFASMGHQGLGDQDIFYSRWDSQKERWTPALNIGPPINSPGRELGFHLSADGRRGFFASDRGGGQGGLDIYGFSLDRDLVGRTVTYVSGYVTDSLSGKTIAEEDVAVGDYTFRTNADGRFFVCAEPTAALPMRVRHPDYLPYRQAFDIPVWDNRQSYRLDLKLRPPGTFQPSPPSPEVVAEPEIVEKTTRVLFAFEQADLAGGEAQTLRAFIDDLGPENIQRIELRGFADEVGTDTYNQDLSERRAHNVALLLAAFGVDRDRIELEGMGEIAGREARRLKRKVEVRVFVVL